MNARFGILLILLFSIRVVADNQVRVIAKSGFKHVQLVELYSSESCSSCPPADEWISNLEKKPGLWTQFVPAVFHVTYWNQLGWQDQLSSDLMTKRQQNLTDLWHTPSMYTPSVIVDGSESRDWRKQDLVKSAISQSQAKITIKQLKENSYQIEIELDKKSLNPPKYKVRVAQLGMGLESFIEAGENEGRHLKHNFVILDWKDQNLMKAKVLQFDFKAPKQKVSKLAIIAWLEEVGNPTPLQAAGGFL